MIPRIQYFDRGSYVLEVDTTRGQRRTRRIPKLSPEQAAVGVANGQLQVKKKVVKGEEVKQPQRPGALRRAANFGKAAVKHRLAGKPKASQQAVYERLAVCKRCPSNMYQILPTEKLPSSLKDKGEIGTCLHKSCGCFLHAENIEPSKLRWADQQCPLGHWKKAVSV